MTSHSSIETDLEDVGAQRVTSRATMIEELAEGPHGRTRA
jgi:hypothetical protein